MVYVLRCTVHSNLGLPVLGIFGSYFIRILAAYLLCLALSRLFLRPHVRFLVWISFLLGAGAYWAFLLARVLGNVPADELAGGGEVNRAPTGFVGLTTWGRPSEWSGGLAVAPQILAWGHVAGLVLSLFMLVRKRTQLL